MRGLFDDDEEIREYDLELDEDLIITDYESDVEGSTDEELNGFVGHLSLFQLQCRNGCGIFAVDEVSLVNVNQTEGCAEFRCPVCNELQTGSLMVLD
jgi:hypothetical protein